MWPWRVKMPTQNFVVVTVADEDRVGNNLLQILNCGLFKKLNFCSDIEHKVWSRFWSWSSGKIWSWSLVSFFCWCFAEVMLYQSWILVEILELGLVKILKFKFYGEAHVWMRFWSWCLVKILKMKFDQDLCLNLWYELNPRVRCAFGNIFNID